MTDERATARIAMITGLIVVATFVAGKAARDAILLSSFAVTSLPIFVGISAVFTFPLVLVTSRALASVGPARLMQLLNVASAVLLLVEWFALPSWPRAGAVIVYLHLAALGPVLVSGFWSTVNERLEPRAAKRRIGRIGLGATLGGILGGVIAERTSAMSTASTILLVLAGLHVVCAVSLYLLERGGPRAQLEVDPSPLAAFRVVARSTLLREVAGLVVVSSMAAVALDYVFKSELVRQTNGAPLHQLALYYTGTSITTALFQLGITGPLVRRLGTPRSVTLLPATVVGMSFVALLVPTPLMSTLARGSEMIVRSSIFRAAYELLFAPLPAKDKRPAKVLLDVGADRLGDLLGAQLVAGLLYTSSSPHNVILAAAGLGAVAFAISLDIRRTYSRALEQSLRAGAAPPVEMPWNTVPAMLGETGALPPLSLLRRSTVDEPAAAPPIDTRDSSLADLADLRSGDLDRVKRVLARPLEPDLVSHVVPLLGWDPVADLARDALKAIAPRITGQLVDALLDQEREFSVRRRLPQVIAHGEPGLASWGLWRALADPRFEVRYRSGKVLARLHGAGHPLGTSSEAVFDAVVREVSVDGRIWQSHRLLDGHGGSDIDALLHGVLEQRSATGLDHVFTLLGLALPAEPLRIALQAVNTSDPVMRGTALEYLESVLPDRVREPLWPFLDNDVARHPQSRTREEIVAALKLSHPSIISDLRGLRNT